MRLLNRLINTVNHISMNTIKELFDNRELAIIIWAIIFFVWALSKKRIRYSFVDVLKAFSVKVIIVSTFMMLLYICGMIYVFYKIKFWEITNLFDTILWVLGVTLIMYVNLNKTRDEGFFIKILEDNLRLFIVLEFVINLYIFDLWIELILIPFLILIGLKLDSSIYSKYKKFESLLNIMNKIIVIFGLCFLIFTLNNIVTDSQESMSIDNLRDYLLPLVFSLVFLPYIFLMALYLVYELIFLHINHLAKNPSQAKYVKRRTICAFHFNLGALNNWVKRIVILDFNIEENIDLAINEVKERSV